MEIMPIASHIPAYDPESLQIQDSVRDYSLWSRVGLNLDTLIMGFSVVVCAAGVAVAFFSGTYFLIPAFIILGALAVYNFNSRKYEHILDEALQAMELNNNRLTRISFNLKRTSEDLQVTSHELRGEVKELKGVRHDLEVRGEELRRVNLELDQRCIELNDVNRGLQDTNASLQRTNDDIKRTSDDLRAVNEELGHTKGQLRDEVVSLTHERRTIHDLNETQRKLLLKLQYKLSIIKDGEEQYLRNLERLETSQRDLEKVSAELNATGRSLEVLERTFGDRAREYAEQNAILEASNIALRKNNEVFGIKLDQLEKIVKAWRETHPDE